MLKPQISILLPHLRNPINDRALHVCLECLMDNTDVDYELIVEAVSVRRDIYPVCNSMAYRANADYIIFHNSDVFVGPGWARPMLESAAPDTIVTGVIAECGAIGVADRNVQVDFGMTPETFDRAAFEGWIGQQPSEIEGIGWYFPSLHNRDSFLARGGFQTKAAGFPVEPVDAAYWDEWIADGLQIKRVASYCYHLQNYSGVGEPEKAIRHGV